MVLYGQFVPWSVRSNHFVPSNSHFVPMNNHFVLTEKNSLKYFLVLSYLHVITRKLTTNEKSKVFMAFTCNGRICHMPTIVKHLCLHAVFFMGLMDVFMDV